MCTVVAAQPKASAEHVIDEQLRAIGTTRAWRQRYESACDTLDLS
jgi:hypothetical protein